MEGVATIKTSVSIQPDIWKNLKTFKNRSGIINDALGLFFARSKALEKADKVFWKSVEESLAGKNDDYISLNPNGEEITDELLEEKLWK